jgi:hypothetical protein
LEKCTKGTDEWKEALQEVNVAANDVINSLDSLDLSADEIKALYNTDKGYMELNKNTLANYQTLMEKRANSASYAASASKIYAENKADSANLLGEIR